MINALLQIRFQCLGFVQKCSQNAGNAISKSQISKMIRGGMPLDALSRTRLTTRTCTQLHGAAYSSFAPVVNQLATPVPRTTQRNRTNETHKQAYLTDAPHLTLRMPAAEAVETSVTTTNSLSQDCTNLDDHNSQISIDTPRFKQLTLLQIYLVISTSL